MPNSYVRNATALTNVRALIEGTLEHASETPARLQNVAYTSASLVQTLQGLADAMTARAAAVASAKDARQAVVDLQAVVGPIVSAYRRYLLVAYANATTLADYGLAPPKERTPLTVEAKLEAVELNHATRKARGTTGPKARLAIKASKPTQETP